MSVPTALHVKFIAKYRKHHFNKSFEKTDSLYIHVSSRYRYNTLFFLSHSCKSAHGKTNKTYKTTPTIWHICYLLANYFGACIGVVRGGYTQQLDAPPPLTYTTRIHVPRNWTKEKTRFLLHQTIQSCRTSYCNIGLSWF